MSRLEARWLLSPDSVSKWSLGALDDYGLSPAQFRVLCAIARRGECFGAVPNLARHQHSIVRAEADGDCLTLHFNDEETLRVWHPSGCEIDAQQFIIRSASRVLWQWYWYGRPHTAGNLMSEEVVRDGATVSFHSTFPGRHTQTPNMHEPAVQIH